MSAPFVAPPGWVVLTWGTGTVVVRAATIFAVGEIDRGNTMVKVGAHTFFVEEEHGEILDRIAQAERAAAAPVSGHALVPLAGKIS